MFLNQKYYVKKIKVDPNVFYQVFCVKDWGDRFSTNLDVGVSRLFKEEEHAQRFLRMLETVQKERAMRYVVQQTPLKIQKLQPAVRQKRVKTIVEDRPVEEVEDEQRI